MMTEAETQILLTRCDHTLSTTLAQIRLAVAQVSPAAKQLPDDSEEKRHLMTGLSVMHQLHAHLLDQLNQLNALSVGMLRSHSEPKRQALAPDNTSAPESAVAADGGDVCSTGSGGTKSNVFVH